jgi:DNA-binding transcriptional LysR family regulator
MSGGHIRRLDLNLLWVFYSVMKHRKLTVAADRLSMTQSAVSHALARLRRTFGDELFVRTGHGLKPTRRALELAPGIAEIIELALDAVASCQRFDPAAEAEYRIGVPDQCAIALAPVLAEIRGQAPGLRFTVRHLWGRMAVNALLADEIDIALCAIPDPRPAGLELLTLFDESYVVIARLGHPFFSGGFDLEAYLAADHAAVAFADETDGIVDRVLATLGRQRRIVITLPLFGAVMQAVGSSDMLATISRVPATARARDYGVGVLELPLLLPPHPVSAAWHQRQSKSGVRRFLLGHIERRFSNYGANLYMVEGASAPRAGAS